MVGRMQIYNQQFARKKKTAVFEQKPEPAVLQKPPP
jgi:hypothetical protein